MRTPSVINLSGNALTSIKIYHNVAPTRKFVVKMAQNLLSKNSEIELINIAFNTSLETQFLKAFED